MNGKGLPAKRRIRYIKQVTDDKGRLTKDSKEVKKRPSIRIPKFGGINDVDWLEVGRLDRGIKIRWMALDIEKLDRRLDRLYLLYYILTISTGLIILWVTLGGKV